MERAEQLAALREGRIHLGLFPCLGEPLETGLDSLTVWSCPMVAVLPAGHPLAEKDEGRTGGMDIQTRRKADVHRFLVKVIAGDKPRPSEFLAAMLGEFRRPS